MNKNLLLTSLFLFLLSTISLSQDTSAFRKNIIGKWYPEKYMETDGKIYPVSAEEAEQYVVYSSDGTFESIEVDGKLAGKWFLHGDKMHIIVTQPPSGDYPQKIDAEIVKLTESELAFKSKDAGGDWLTIYLKKRQ
jgi:hypothetical protein